MGIELKTYLNACGVEVEQGFFELSEVGYRSYDSIIFFSGHIWLSKEVKDEGFSPIDSFDGSFPVKELPEENIMRYTYKKILEIANEDDAMTTHPKYKGFIDGTYVE